MTSEEAVKIFGFAPESVGNRHRAWWVIEKPDEDDSAVGASAGDLCVKARDGGGNPIDVEAFKVGDCIGTIEDSYDCTYRYYYYHPLTPNEATE